MELQYVLFFYKKFALLDEFLQLDYGNYNDKGPPHIVFFFYFILFLASFFLVFSLNISFLAFDT